MCILCGGQCGGLGDFFISMGLPFLALFLYKLKNWFSRIRNRVLRRGSRPAAPGYEELSGNYRGEVAGDCRVRTGAAIAPETLNLLELEPQEGRGPRGVRGWLLLLCLNLTIIIPFLSLYQVNCALRIFYLPGAQIQIVIFKHSLLYNILTIVIMLFISIFSFFAGLKLWGEKPRAEKTAKIFLLAQLSLVIIMLSIRILVPFSFYSYTSAFKTIITGLISSISYFIIWYLYLTYSRRVRNTYGCLA
jgi:hypothetical protein